ncbi:MAG TPA: hypothetical protein VKV02_03735 [Acidobacteriaceae bacterium]|nr:hypothetical protein [Acidobacteriaceae bacterium]
MAQHQNLGVLPPRLPPRQAQHRHGPGHDEEAQLQAHKPKIIAPRDRPAPAPRHPNARRADRDLHSICPGDPGFRHPHLIQTTKFNRADVVNRAISIYAMVTDYMRAGNELVFRDPESGKEQIVKII